jgi:hypothetical protein
MLAKSAGERMTLTGPVILPGLTAKASSAGSQSYLPLDMRWLLEGLQVDEP